MDNHMESKDRTPNPLSSEMTEAFTFFESESKWILYLPVPKWMVNRLPHPHVYTVLPFILLS